VRSVVVHALRFTLTEEARRAVPPSTLHKFLGALGDEDLKARAFAARAFAQPLPEPARSFARCGAARC